MTDTTDNRPTCADLVSDRATSTLETIRLMLCPNESDVELIDDGTLDTVLRIGDDEYRYSHEFASAYRDDETGELDLEDLVSDVFEEIREQQYERFFEYGLSFEYINDSDRCFHPWQISWNRGEHYFRYQISWGGPSTEIRFFANHDLTLYRAEFWYMDWFDGASKTITNDPTTQILWEQFVECGTAEHAREKALNY